MTELPVVGILHPLIFLFISLYLLIFVSFIFYLCAFLSLYFCLFVSFCPSKISHFLHLSIYTTKTKTKESGRTEADIGRRITIYNYDLPD